MQRIKILYENVCDGTFFLFCCAKAPNQGLLWQEKNARQSAQQHFYHRIVFTMEQSFYHGIEFLPWNRVFTMEQSFYHGIEFLPWNRVFFTMEQSFYHGTEFLPWNRVFTME